MTTHGAPAPALTCVVPASADEHTTAASAANCTALTVAIVEAMQATNRERIGHVSALPVTRGNSNVVQSTPHELADSAKQTLDITVPSHHKEVAEVIQREPHESTPDRFVEQTVVPVPQIREDVAAAFSVSLKSAAKTC